jgi:hypothetical protein
MEIEIIHKDCGLIIADFELESNPFKVGETINIHVTNYNKEIWDVTEVYGEYRIDKIEHFLNKRYANNVNTTFAISVEVTKID